MKVNFKNILCRPSLKSEELISIDITADLADAIYQGTTSFEDYQLAVAIFNSDGEMELTESQIQSITKYVSSFPIWVQIAVIDACYDALHSNGNKEPEPSPETTAFDDTLSNTQEVNEPESVEETDKKKPARKKSK